MRLARTKKEKTLWPEELRIAMILLEIEPPDFAVCRAVPKLTTPTCTPICYTEYNYWLI